MFVKVLARKESITAICKIHDLEYVTYARMRLPRHSERLVKKICCKCVSSTLLQINQTLVMGSKCSKIYFFEFSLPSHMSRFDLLSMSYFSIPFRTGRTFWAQGLFKETINSFFSSILIVSLNSIIWVLWNV